MRHNASMQLPHLSSKRAVFVALVVAVVAVAEFLIFESTIGVSLPTDRNSALSTLEIKTKGTDIHFITRNKRFTVVDYWYAHGTRREGLVLRESFFMDRVDSREGPPDATVTVEAMQGNRVRWTFREAGERGDVVTNKLYMVTKFNGGEIGTLYTYFSLANGQKLRSNQFLPLSTRELEALDLSIDN
jgi:hypothetical protein